MYWLRWIELIGIFVLGPVTLALAVNDLDAWLMPLLFTSGFICLWVLLRDDNFKRFRLWNTQGFKDHLRNALRLFIPLACLTTVFIYFVFPDLLFNLPANHLKLWLVTLAIYPLVSVIPQEVIFRTFFFHRYKPILPSKNHRWMLSSLSFALAHIVYGNWVAVALSGFGGTIFGYRYMQTRSTLIVVVEHTLWGSFLFTVGLGVYFLTSTAL